MKKYRNLVEKPGGEIQRKEVLPHSRLDLVEKPGGEIHEREALHHSRLVTLVRF